MHMAIIRKSITDCMKFPYVSATLPTVSPVAGSTVPARKTSSSPVRSILPMARLMRGVIISFTRDVTILPKALPMITPTAMSTTLPFMANALKSLKNFFIKKPSLLKLFSSFSISYEMLQFKTKIAVPQGSLEKNGGV